MVLTGISPAAERRLLDAWPFAAGEIFDKVKFEDLLANLQTHQEQVFGVLPVHYENVGHWLQTDAGKNTVDVLLDFKGLLMRRNAHCRRHSEIYSALA